MTGGLKEKLLVPKKGCQFIGGAIHATCLWSDTIDETKPSAKEDEKFSEESDTSQDANKQGP